MFVEFFNFSVGNIKQALKRHSSIFIMGSGAFFFFISNVILKYLLSSFDYGKYSMLMVVITLLSSFGLLGFEQVFLRLSRVGIEDKHVIFIDKSVLVFNMLAFAVVVFIAVFLSIHLYFDFENFPYIFIIVFCVIGNLFVFNVLRLASKFNIAQLVNTYWKITLGGGVIILYSLTIDLDFITILKYLSIVIIAGFIISVFILQKNVRIVAENKYPLKKILLYGFSFFISLLTVSLLGQGDKFLVESMMGVDQLGEYFFYANIFLFPFSFLQSYAGFKELTKFKSEKGNSPLPETRKWLIASGLLSVGLFISFIILSHVGITDVLIGKIWIIIAFFILTGFVRVVYGLFSAYMGAKGGLKAIGLANTLSILSIMLSAGVLYLLPVHIYSIMFVYLLAWVFRLLIWRYSLIHFSDYA